MAGHGLTRGGPVDTYRVGVIRNKARGAVRAQTRKNPSSGRNRKRTNTSNRKTKVRSQLPPSGGAETGPCLTDAAPEAAPDRAVREQAATPKPERVPRRSWRQSAPVVPCPSPQLVGRIGAAADALPPLGAA